AARISQLIAMALPLCAPAFGTACWPPRCSMRRASRATSRTPGVACGQHGARHSAAPDCRHRILGFGRHKAAMLRMLLVALLALAFAAPARAQIDIMAPFNQPSAMDDARVLAEDLAYADGDRKHLSIYGPNEIME